MKLTKEGNFVLREFLKSDTAERHGIDNTPNEKGLANIKRTAETLEEVRALFNAPVIISSGFRSRALNRKVGGSVTSDHAYGLAADFSVRGYTDKEVCERIRDSDIQFDQLIYEQGSYGNTWVHLGVGERMRRDVISWRSGRGYRQGIVDIK